MMEFILMAVAASALAFAAFTGIGYLFIHKDDDIEEGEDTSW